MVFFRSIFFFFFFGLNDTLAQKEKGRKIKSAKQFFMAFRQNAKKKKKYSITIFLFFLKNIVKFQNKKS
jgi:hypothetical protein